MKAQEKMDVAALVIAFIAVILFLMFILASIPASGEPDTSGIWMELHFNRVVDGDTFVIIKGVQDRCRMIGYNAPEKKEDPELYAAAKAKLIEIFARGSKSRATKAWANTTGWEGRNEI